MSGTSEILDLCLSSVCVITPAYTSLCRGLEYLLKLGIFLKLILTESDFWFLRQFFWKIHHKNERHLRLIARIITKLPQNVYLVSNNILIYRHARYDCKLWNAHWFYWVFLGIFIHFIDDHSCLKCCIFTKLLQIMCLINIHNTHIMICNLFRLILIFILIIIAKRKLWIWWRSEIIYPSTKYVHEGWIRILLTSIASHGWNWNDVDPIFEFVAFRVAFEHQNAELCLH